MRDRESPGSVLSVVKSARDNARLVRTALTSEVWTAVNEMWLLLCDVLKDPVRVTELPQVLSTIRQQSALVRGVPLGMVFGRMPLWHFKTETAQISLSAKIKELSQLIGQGESVLQGMHKASAAVLAAVPKETGQTSAGTTAQEAIEIGKGVCQDHAHIFLAVARTAGLSARYVSGYLRMSDRVDQNASHALGRSLCRNHR